MGGGGSTSKIQKPESAYVVSAVAKLKSGVNESATAASEKHHEEHHENDKLSTSTTQIVIDKKESGTGIQAQVDLHVGSGTSDESTRRVIEQPHEVTEVTAMTPRDHQQQIETLEVQSLEHDDGKVDESAPAIVPKKKKKKVKKDHSKKMEQCSEVELLRMVMARERNGTGAEPDTARLLLHLVARWCDKGKYMEAEPQLERAVGILEASLGPAHEDTQAAQANLKAVYRRNGKAPMGDDRETTAALVHMQIEREKQAQRQNASAAAARRTAYQSERKSDTDSAATSAPPFAFSDMPAGEGFRDPAWPYETILRRGGIRLKKLTHVQLLQMLVAKEKCGSCHDVDTARILTNLAARLLKKGKLIEAEQMLVKAVQILVQEHGEGHAETSAARGSLAELYRRNGKVHEGSRILCFADVSKLTGLGV